MLSQKDFGTYLFTSILAVVAVGGTLLALLVAAKAWSEILASRVASAILFGG